MAESEERLAVRCGAGWLPALLGERHCCLQRCCLLLPAGCCHVMDGPCHHAQPCTLSSQFTTITEGQPILEVNPKFDAAAMAR
jgi:hypothetical protein